MWFKSIRASSHTGHVDKMGRKISKQECKIISRSTSSRPRELSWQEPPRRSIRGGMLGHCLAHISFDLLHHKQSCKIRFSSDPSPIIGYPCH